MNALVAPTFTFLGIVAVAAAIRWLSRPPGRVVSGEGRLHGWRRRRFLPAWHRRAAEARAAEAALPGLLDEVAGAVRAGASLAMALADVSTGPTGSHTAMRLVLARTERGAVLAEALEDWRRTATDPAGRLAATALAHAAAVGAADPRALEAAADTLRERSGLRGEIRTQAAQAHASAMVLTAVPPLFLATVVAADPDVAAFVLGTAAGWACLVGGLALDGLGAWWMRRIVIGAVP